MPTTLDQINSAEWSLSISSFGEVVEGFADIDQCIQLILNTAKGSDPLRPEFGSDIWKYLDRPINIAAPSIVREILDALATWEERIQVTDVTYDIEGGGLLFNVRWILVGNKQKGSTAKVALSSALKNSASATPTKPEPPISLPVPLVAYSSRMYLVSSYTGPKYTTENGNDTAGDRLDYLYDQAGSPALERPSNVDEGDEFMSVAGGVMTAGSVTPTDMRGNIGNAIPFQAFTLAMRINPADLAGSQSRPFGFSEGDASNFGLRRVFTTLQAVADSYSIGLVHATQTNIVTNTANVVVPALEWSFVVFVWDGAEVKAYVNGELKSSASASIFAGITARSVRVSSPIGAPHNPYQSTDYLIYRVALTDKQVSQISTRLLP